MTTLAALASTQLPALMADLSFEHEPGRIWLKGTINGMAVRTMLDTGAGGIFVTEAAAARLGASKGIAGRANTIGGGSDAWQASGLTFGLEGAPFLTPATAIVSFTKATPIALPEVAAGLPLFAAFGVSVDYVNRRVRFYSPGAFVPPTDAVALRLTFKDGTPRVRMRLRMPGGRWRDIVALVDTGSPVGLEVTRRLARRDGMDARYASVAAAAQPGGVGGPTQAREVSGIEAEFGGTKVNGTALVNLTDEGSTGRGADYDALVGDDLLKHFDVAFDYLREKLWIRPNGK